MEHIDPETFVVSPDDPILITGATGFIGPHVVHTLLRLGFRKLRIFARPAGDVNRIIELSECCEPAGRIEVVRGNLLSIEDCKRATDKVSIIFHLAMSGGKSFADSFMNCALTTRNLLESSLQNARLRRFVNVSSFAVYTNTDKAKSRLLDESCPVETNAVPRGDAYCFGKIKQDEIVADYGNRFGIPYVIVRPGSVYGPGKKAITGRIGIDTFGMFLHLGGSNRIPLTYVENCADAIVLAGLKQGADGQVFNVVDDDLPTSRRFLNLYKRNVDRFRSIYVPHPLSYILCWLWEKYSDWSEEQLPPAFNRKRWHAEWKSTRYDNRKLKSQLGWAPRVPTAEGLRRYFEYCRNGEKHA